MADETQEYTTDPSSPGAQVWTLHDNAAQQPMLDRAQALFAKGGLAGAEAYHIHRELLASHRAHYDQNVAARIELGAQVTREKSTETREGARGGRPRDETRPGI